MSDPNPDRRLLADGRLPVVRRRPPSPVMPTPASTQPQIRPDHGPATTATAAAQPPVAVARRRPASQRPSVIVRPPVVARRPVPPTTVQPIPPTPTTDTTAAKRAGQQPPNAHSPYGLRQFVAEADRFRAEHRIAVVDGLLTVHEVVGVAREPRGKPLLRIPLRGLLAERPGCGPQRGSEALRRLCTTLGLAALPASTTIAWLIDARVNGARILAWLDAVETADLLPDGFPFSDTNGTAS